MLQKQQFAKSFTEQVFDDHIQFFNAGLNNTIYQFNKSKMISLEKVQLSKYPKQNKMLQQELSNILNQSMIKLEGGAYNYFKCERVFKILKQIRADYLKLSRNYNPNIVMEIKDIYFQNLQTLNLAQNRIVSLQPLMLLTAPKLSSLDISQNRIISLKTLRKLPFILVQLSIHNNPLLELNCFQSIRFGKAVKYISLQGQKNGPCLGEDASNIVKMQAINLKHIVMKKRLNHSIVMGYLNARNSGEQGEQFGYNQPYY